MQRNEHNRNNEYDNKHNDNNEYDANDDVHDDNNANSDNANDDYNDDNTSVPCCSICNTYAEQNDNGVYYCEWCLKKVNK